MLLGRVAAVSGPHEVAPLIDRVVLGEDERNNRAAASEEENMIWSETEKSGLERVWSEQACS